MEIFLDKRALKQIRLSATEAIEEGEVDTLRDDIAEAFTDEQVEEIERRIDNADFYDFLGEILDEWSGDDVDELFELLEGQLSDGAIGGAQGVLRERHPPLDGVGERGRADEVLEAGREGGA